MLEPLGERVAALTAEQRKYFISRVLANWEALMGTKGKQSAPGRCVSSALVRPAAAIFVMRLILVCLHPKAGMAFNS
jgi:hypothetical protein